MNVPPPFSPPTAPAKKNNTGLIIVIVLACILIPCIGLIAVMAMGFNWFTKEIGPIASCAIGFEMVRDSIVDYSEANKGMLPKAETWQDDVRPFYAKRMQKTGDEFGPFRPMPADGDWGCKSGESMTGIAFNSDLSGKELKKIEDLSTVLIFEIEDPRKNAHEPFKRRSKQNSPKIMGESRGWIEMPIEGDAQGFSSGGRGRVRVDPDSDSDSQTKPDSKPPTSQ